MMSRRAAVYGRAQLRALTLGGAVWDAETAKMQIAGTLSGPCRFRVHFAVAYDFWQIPANSDLRTKFWQILAKIRKSSEFLTNIKYIKMWQNFGKIFSDF